MDKNINSININKTIKTLSDNCMLIDKIGEGSFGDVYIGKNKAGKKIAIKDAFRAVYCIIKYRFFD